MEGRPNYLGHEDERGLAKYMDCGTVLFKSNTGHHEKVLEHYRELGVEFEDWDTAMLAERVPYYDLHAFWPPRRPEDEVFWPSTGGAAAGCHLHADPGT